MEESLLEHLDQIDEESKSMSKREEQVAILQGEQDYLADIPSAKQYKYSNNTFYIESYRHCPEEYIEYVLSLTIDNMKTVYEENWGFYPEAIEMELFEGSSRYLIATKDDMLAGFVHFRFEQQSDEIVIYVYQIQVDPKFQREHLGKALLTAIELIGLKRHVSSAMCMVFKSNIAALSFFQAMNFSIHKSSPNTESCKQIIMYKSLRTQ